MKYTSLGLSCLFVVVFWTSTIRSEDSDIDFAVTLKSNTAQSHQDAYLIALFTELRRCFGSMVAKSAMENTAVKDLKDGAAGYRLFVDANLNISYGSTLATEREAANQAQNGGFFRVFWYLPFTHQGTLQFKLCRWNGQKYADLEKWTAPLIPLDFEGLKNGRIAVAEAFGGGGNSNPAFPGKLEDAQLRTTQKITPGLLGDAIFAHWLQIAVLSATPTKEANSVPNVLRPISFFNVEYSIKNTSPWAIRRVRAITPFQGQTLIPGDAGTDGFWINFVEPVPPNKTVRLTVPARLGPKDVKPGIFGVEAGPAPKP